MIMIVKTPGSQMGSPAAAEEGGEEMGGEKCESGERSEQGKRRILMTHIPQRFTEQNVLLSQKRTHGGYRDSARFQITC